MFLKKLYSEPNNIFAPITFKEGVNFIFAKKDTASDPKNSLNGVGKTLSLHFLDYCLLSQMTNALKSARDNNSNIKDQWLVLEFSIDGKDYIIKRSLDPKQQIIFGETEDPKKYKSSVEPKRLLTDLIFRPKSYAGKYRDTWLRKLIPFFVKKQQTRSEKFTDPILYIKEKKERELVAYHLFLLGIDNSLVHKNNTLYEELGTKQPALKEAKQLIKDAYHLDSISEAENEIAKLSSQIQKLENNLKRFELAQQYSDVEERANRFTKEIKELLLQNFSDKRKIDSYKESFDLVDDVNVRKIKRLYSELNKLLGENIAVTLKDALLFRKQIAESRISFLRQEIQATESTIRSRQTKINTLEQGRSQLFGFLDAQKAISDLSEAYLDLSNKRKDLGDLSSKIRLYQDLSREEAEIKKEAADLYAQIVVFAQQVQPQLLEFRKVFFDFHDAIYFENKDKASFTLTAKESVDVKLKLNVSLPADLSKGKNQGRTLVYDLAVLFHGIQKGLKMPRFLIHDGIFDGVDKAHFVSLYEYLNQLKADGKKFQYIITLNEEGTLSEKFGDADKVTPENIEQEAVLVLTPSSKLLNNSWG